MTATDGDAASPHANVAAEAPAAAADAPAIIAAVEARVRTVLESNDASHDWAHTSRVRALALSLAARHAQRGATPPQGRRLSGSAACPGAHARTVTQIQGVGKAAPRYIHTDAHARSHAHNRPPIHITHREGLDAGQRLTVELAALLHDCADWKYTAPGQDAKEAATAFVRVRALGECGHTCPQGEALQAGRAAAAAWLANMCGAPAQRACEGCRIHCHPSTQSTSRPAAAPVPCQHPIPSPPAPLTPRARPGQGLLPPLGVPAATVDLVCDIVTRMGAHPRDASELGARQRVPRLQSCPPAACARAKHAARSSGHASTRPSSPRPLPCAGGAQASRMNCRLQVAGPRPSCLPRARWCRTQTGARGQPGGS